MLEQWFSAALQTPSWGIVALSYGGGVVSTLLPCSIAMLPLLVGYIGGYAPTRSRSEVLLQVLLFVVGLGLVLSVMGVASAILGLTFGGWVNQWWLLGAGLLAAAMGMQLLGWIHLPLPQIVQTLPNGGAGKTGIARFVAPISLGALFGLASSPCGTPFLAGILALISQTGDVALGGASLFAYALGQGTLLLIVGLFTGLLKHRARLYHVGERISHLSGAVFVAAGAVLILKGFGVSWLS